MQLFYSRYLVFNDYFLLSNIKRFGERFCTVRKMSTDTDWKSKQTIYEFSAKDIDDNEV